MPSRRDILLVDDDVAIVAFLIDLFTDEGYAVRTAVTGGQALAAVATAHPALILLDLALPDIGGAEVLRRLRTTAQYTGAILIMSTRSDGGASLHLPGVSAYLAKPFAFDVLLTSVQQYAGPLSTHPA